jgi:hypothetical protein
VFTARESREPPSAERPPPPNAGPGRPPAEGMPQPREQLAGPGVAAPRPVPPHEAAPPGRPAANGPSDGVWEHLRRCESGGRYDRNTGNGLFGAYQMAPVTWRSLGYDGLPHEASPPVQDQAARRLQARNGWGQWPRCSTRLGLR